MDKLFSQALLIISNSFNLSNEDIMRRNMENCVNARYILIGSVCKYFSDNELSNIFHTSRSLINKIRNSISKKCNQSYLFKQKFSEISSKIACVFEQK